MIILGTNSVKDTGFDVANSCRFDRASSSFLHADNFIKHTDTNKFTISAWVKRSSLGTNQAIFSQRHDNSYSAVVKFKTDDTIEVSDVRADSDALQVVTTRKFRDVSAWYNIVVSSDVSVSSPALKIFVNGVQETVFTTSNQYSQNEQTSFNNGYRQEVGSHNGDYFDGYIAQIVFIDGYAYNADSFGEFDEDSGIWKPISISSLTTGTNGRFLDFADSSDLGKNAFPINQNYTVNNLTAIDQSTDTCTNNFATLNPLRTQAGYTKVMSEGNCVWEHGQAGQNASIPSTIAASSGKWYAEFLCSTSANNWGFGIAQVNVTNGGSMAGYPDSQGGVTYTKNGNLSWYAGGDQSSDTGTTFAADDIIAILMDLDNTRVYWYKNDTLVNSGGFDYSVVNSGSTIENNYYFMVGATDDGTNPIIKANFGGSPGFAISSGNTDGNGYGNFEFATKGGYALNTKNLAEYG